MISTNYWTVQDQMHAQIKSSKTRLKHFQQMKSLMHALFINFMQVNTCNTIFYYCADMMVLLNDSVVQMHKVLYNLRGKKWTVHSRLMKTRLNNVLLPTLFNVVNNIVTPDSNSKILFNILFGIVTLDLGLTILLKTVNNMDNKTLFNPVFINLNGLITFCFAHEWIVLVFLQC